MRAAQVEILKEKILAGWRPMMDEAADGVLAAMQAEWQAKVAEINAHQAGVDFRTKLRSLWESGASE